MSAAWEAEADALRAARPRHVLFLCVANSARSQLAEGIARALAPAGVRISSAGSRPTALNPLAVRALAELGIDASGQVSKGVEEIPPGDVEAVVTLCAEEVCPAFLGKALRVHWGLPDPARADGDDEARLEAFRRVRDELRRRLRRVFAPEDAGAGGASVDVAADADLDAVRALLARLHLPAADVGRAGQTFLVARAGGAVAGCIGLEACGDDLLLRSLAVDPARQGTGLGRALHAAALAEAERRGARALYLLTTTAERFFARAGFERIDRAAVPAPVAATLEFRSLCPSTAVCMRRVLRPGAPPG